MHQVRNISPIPLFKTATRTIFQFPLYRISRSAFVWFIHTVQGRYDRYCSISGKGEISCFIKQGVRRDLTYHIDSMGSISSSSISCIRSNKIETSIGVLVHLAVLRNKVTANKFLIPSPRVRLTHTVSQGRHDPLSRISTRDHKF